MLREQVLWTQVEINEARRVLAANPTQQVIGFHGGRFERKFLRDQLTIAEKAITFPHLYSNWRKVAKHHGQVAFILQ